MDGIRSAVRADRSQFFKELPTPFYGANRPGGSLTDGMRDAFWRQGMQAGMKAVVDCIAAFSETDFTADLKRLDVPVLLIHGDDDQIVPIGGSAIRTAALVPGARLLVYEGGDHGICATRKDRVNADLLAFLRS